MTTKIETTKTEKILQTFTFKTKEGILFSDEAAQGQREIMECILRREAPDGSGRKRIHVMAHTRYGKSMAVGAAVAVRAAVKKEPWAIIAPTKEQAQIIMDYVIYFAINDPIIRNLLKTDAKILQEERLTQRRSRDHITFLDGGEVRTFAAGTTMGHGAPNLVLDEAGLIDNNTESRIFRMLGDSTDNFIIKIGNPWFSIDYKSGEPHHFYNSFSDEDYYLIDIPVNRGIAEGRVTEGFHKEVQKKANYDVLYLNVFPDTAEADPQGYYPLFGHKLVKEMLVEPHSIPPTGKPILGADPADGGSNESVIAKRYLT